MPFDNTDTYQQPANTAAVTGQTISSQKHNILNKDHKDALTTRASKAVVSALTQTVTTLSNAFNTHVSGAFTTLSNAFNTHVSGAFTTLSNAFNTHVNITTANVHKATQITFTPQGGVSATTVQAAIVQAASMGGGGSGGGGGGVALPITINDVTNLQTTLDSKAATTHAHTINDVTNLQTTLDSKAAVAHTHDIATQLSDGFMSSYDKSRLNGGKLIETWQPNTFYGINSTVRDGLVLFRRKANGSSGAFFSANLADWERENEAHDTRNSVAGTNYFNAFSFKSTLINLAHSIVIHPSSHPLSVGFQHIIIFKQDATGGRTVTDNFYYIGTFNLKMGANEVTVFSLVWDGSKYHITRLTQ